MGTEAIDSFSQLLVGLITGRSDFPTRKPDNPQGGIGSVDGVSRDQSAENSE